MRRIKNAAAASYHGRCSKELDQLKEGDVVRMQPMALNSKVWKKAKVTKQLDDRSYEIDPGDDILRRNRVHKKDRRGAATGPVGVWRMLKQWRKTVQDVLVKR